MSKNKRHSKRRGGIYDSSRGVKQNQVRKKYGIMSLIKAKLAGAPVPIGQMRSMSVTKHFRKKRKEKEK